MTSKQIRYKARKFIELGLVKDFRKYYCVFPLPGNKTIHKVWKDKEGFWHCDCQYHRTTGRTCSHILACGMLGW